MKEFKDFIVVEFLRAQRFFKKLSLAEFNDRKKQEWSTGEIDFDRWLIGVYENEQDADKFIAENKDQMERFCMITAQDGSSYVI